MGSVLLFKLQPANGDAVAHLHVVPGDQRDGEVFGEVEAGSLLTFRVGVDRRKTAFVDFEVTQHLADVAQYIGVTLPGQVGNLAAGHGEGVVGGVYGGGGKNRCG